MRNRIVKFLTIAESIVLLLHWFVFETLKAFHAVPDSEVPRIGLAIGILSVTFLTASLLAFKYSNLFVRLYYKAVAVWLGLFSFLVLAACASWISFGIASLAGLRWDRPWVAHLLFGAALVVSTYGLVNASRIRVNKVTVKLPNLPDNWRGRTAALITDAHLGHVRARRFMERIVRIVARSSPDLVLIGGDLYDGTAVDERNVAEPLQKFAAPFGTFFVTGNHERPARHEKYFAALGSAGVRVLINETANVDGLQIVGVSYLDSTDADHYRKTLREISVDPNRASVLLVHAPHHLPVAAEAGIGLQLSGHTHGGQYFPFTTITARIYGTFVHGLNKAGNMFVYTSYGVGTWGPPLRVGTTPEIVLIKFE